MADKSEPRFNVDLPIRVFGVDADDRVFSQVAHARNISEHGAKLVGLEETLNPGDIIGVHFGDKKARCNVIWVVDARETHKIDVGVKVMEGQPHPWQEQVETQQAIGTAPVSRIAPATKDKRKFPRQRIFFQIEIRGGQGDAPMRTRTADIAGNGCYIETMLPLPVGRVLIITFWLDSESVRTAAIVRTCDRGVGMGIEFTGLDQATQKRLQQQVESIAVESDEIVSGAEITDVWMHR
jgi:PilZ domain